eukprot:TRINITY_DN780239_c0_g1_i1.p1 TRINITY_DN780239_c0_g1~~TRINITY_DN780239_c0_g1_i1.p1  ORF type:complete len:207 (-),score=38.61 TRINITY_DN780239_c0_g1_i1:76-645(-)
MSEHSDDEYDYVYDYDEEYDSEEEEETEEKLNSVETPKCGLQKSEEPVEKVTKKTKKVVKKTAESSAKPEISEPPTNSVVGKIANIIQNKCPDITSESRALLAHMSSNQQNVLKQLNTLTGVVKEEKIEIIRKMFLDAPAYLKKLNNADKELVKCGKRVAKMRKRLEKDGFRETQKKSENDKENEQASS